MRSPRRMRTLARVVLRVDPPTYVFFLPIFALQRGGIRRRIGRNSAYVPILLWKIP